MNNLILTENKAAAKPLHRHYDPVSSLLGVITDFSASHILVDGKYIIERAKIKTDRLVRKVVSNDKSLDKPLNKHLVGQGHIFHFSEPVYLIDDEGCGYHPPADGSMIIYCSDSSRVELVNGEWVITR